MRKKLNKYLKYFLYGLLGFSVFLIVIGYFFGEPVKKSETLNKQESKIKEPSLRDLYNECKTKAMSCSKKLRGGYDDEIILRMDFLNTCKDYKNNENQLIYWIDDFGKCS